MRFIILILMRLRSGRSHAAALDSSAGRLQVSVVADGLDAPWAFGFLPDGGVLITEKRWAAAASER